MSRTGSLGVCIFPEPGLNAARTVCYPNYVHEILGYAGLCYSSIAFGDLTVALDKLGILVTVGETQLDLDVVESLREWVRSGGVWLSVGGVCGAGDVFGAELEPAAFSSWGGGLCTLGEGYLLPKDASHKILSHLAIPLHFFNGCAAKAVGAKVLAEVLDAHQRPTDRAAITENAFGEGKAMLIAPDVPGTVVYIQQGAGVMRDGVPAPDGTGALCDSVLKSSDGAVLDWIFDREPVPGVPGLNAFLQPIADQWRELLLRAIFYMVETQGAALPLLWLYPRNLPALAHMSHDTDGSEVEKARTLLETLKQAKINTTWCVITPPYPKEIIEAIKSDGHEVGTHYNANPDGGPWSEENFDSQWRILTDLFEEQPSTNKNHYLRWEGDIEFFEWLIARGIRLDETKGPSKTGEAGFNFGSCQLCRPVDFAGNIMDIYELPTLTQDLIVFAPPALLEPLVLGARKHHGIMHLLFHPAHIEESGESDILLHSVERARECGMEWWTARDIVNWFEARRSASWELLSADSDHADVALDAGAALKGATLMWIAPSGSRVKLNGSEQTGEVVERWGFEFTSTVLDLPAGSRVQLEIER